MSEKVISFPLSNPRFNIRKKRPKTGRITPRSALREAKYQIGDFENIVIVGQLKSGGLYVASDEEKEAAVFLLEKAKMYLFFGSVPE